MKKVRNFFVAAFVVLSVLSCCACSEGAPQKSGAAGTAIALGHGNCITEVTVIVDGYGNPVKVQFDDIFPASNVYNNTALGDKAPTETVDGKAYYKYLRIGTKYFQVNASGMYAEIGVQDGISDLMAYYKTEEGTQWYYDSFLAGALKICAEADDGVAVGSLTLKDVYSFNTANGSMRKRYSRYWSASGGGNIGQVSGLGFNGNMEMLENYLLTYGFSALDADGAIILPKDSGTGYNVIGGVTTGATLSSDTGIYLRVAKAAYEIALAAQKDNP